MEDSGIRIPDPIEVPMRPTALKYAVPATLALIVLGLVLYVTGLSQPGVKGNNWNTIQQVLGNIVSFAVPILAIKHHRDSDLGGYITFGRSLGIGTLTGFFMGMITFVWVVIFFYLIAPQLQESLVQIAVEQARARGVSDEDIESQRFLFQIFTNPVIIGFFGWILTVLIAFLGSLLGGAIFKKEPPGSV